MAFLPDETPWTGGRISESVYCYKANNPSPMSYVGTNVYVVSSAGFPGLEEGQPEEKPEALVIDPAPSGRTVDEIIALVDQLGVEIVGVALTHNHHDHSEGACELIEKLAQKRHVGVEDIPLYAKSFSLESAQEIAAQTKTVLPQATERISFITLDEGGLIEFGDKLLLKVLCIPGHSDDSVAFYFAEDNVLFIGDIAFRHGPTVVYHPDGVLADYMASLDLLDAFAEEHSGIVFASGHGTLIDNPKECVEATRKHRQERLDQIIHALSQGVEAVDEALVDVVYVDIDSRLRPAALRSVQAQLLYLQTKAE
ncbi:MAG: MBL fold metallo-hydrolase [Anaerotardibacter sp.]